MTRGYVGGWLSESENRSEIALTSKPMLLNKAPESLPEEMGIKKWMQIESQGSQGACAGHARTSCLELGIYHQTKGTVVQLCRQFAYITAQILDGINGDNGSTIISNAKAGEKWGTCREEYWPYTGRYNRNIPQIAYDKASEYLLNSHVQCNSYDDVFRFLTLGLGGVQIGIDWTLDDSPVPLESYSRWGSVGGHSVSFLDWSSKKDSKGRRYLVLFNSWGKSWADGGTRLIAPDAVDQMFGSRNTVMLGLSDLKDLKPRSVIWTGSGSVF